MIRSLAKLLKPFSSLRWRMHLKATLLYLKRIIWKWQLNKKASIDASYMIAPKLKLRFEQVRMTSMKLNAVGKNNSKLNWFIATCSIILMLAMAWYVDIPEILNISCIKSNKGACSLLFIWILIFNLIELKAIRLMLACLC